MGSTTRPASEFYKMPLVQSHIDLAAAQVGREATNDFHDTIGQLMADDVADYGAASTVSFYDSPLEAIFWVWWIAAARFDAFCREDLILHQHVHARASGREYVIDYAVRPTRSLRSRYEGAWPSVGVELDGHAFHEKTLEQVTRRNQRDRDLQQAGWEIFHFSFDEFTKKPDECVSEVVERMRAHLADLCSRHWERTQAQKHVAAGEVPSVPRADS